MSKTRLVREGFSQVYMSLTNNLYGHKIYMSVKHNLDKRRNKFNTQFVHKK